MKNEHGPKRNAIHMLKRLDDDKRAIDQMTNVERSKQILSVAWEWWFHDFIRIGSSVVTRAAHLMFQLVSMTAFSTGGVPKWVYD